MTGTILKYGITFVGGILVGGFTVASLRNRNDKVMNIWKTIKDIREECIRSKRTEYDCDELQRIDKECDRLYNEVCSLSGRDINKYLLDHEGEVSKLYDDLCHIVLIY